MGEMGMGVMGMGMGEAWARRTEDRQTVGLYKKERERESRYKKRAEKIVDVLFQRMIQVFVWKFSRLQR
jgi:hypothetical protein